jgi:hypothetical protein
VQIDITGTEGDIRIVNTSAFGDVGDDYQAFGARGDRLDLLPLKIPAHYNILPDAGLPSAVRRRRKTLPHSPWTSAEEPRLPRLSWMPCVCTA